MWHVYAPFPRDRTSCLSVAVWLMSSAMSAHHEPPPPAPRPPPLPLLLYNSTRGWVGGNSNRCTCNRLSGRHQRHRSALGLAQARVGAASTRTSQERCEALNAPRRPAHAHAHAGNPSHAGARAPGVRLPSSSAHTLAPHSSNPNSTDAPQLQNLAQRSVSHRCER